MFQIENSADIQSAGINLLEGHIYNSIIYHIEYDRLV